jgi:hypothetical protein
MSKWQRSGVAGVALIHDQEPWWVFVLTVSMPIASLASLWDFFESNAVPLAAGFVLWFWIAYEAIARVPRHIMARSRA